MKKYIIASLVAIVGILGVAAHVQANPLYFIPSTKSATATTSFAMISPINQATSTALDAYASVNQVIEGGTLLLQMTASSTGNAINVKFQYSNDNLDWYDDNYEVPGAATSTVYIANPITYNWVSSGTGVANKAIPFNTPTRYTRAIISSGVATSSVWYEMVPKRQIK